MKVISLLIIVILLLGSCSNTNQETNSVSCINTGRTYKVSESLPEGFVYRSTTKPYRYYISVKDKNNRTFYFYLTKEQQKDFESNNQ